jgi:hypothetical protein
VLLLLALEGRLLPKAIGALEEQVNTPFVPTSTLIVVAVTATTLVVGCVVTSATALAAAATVLAATVFAATAVEGAAPKEEVDTPFIRKTPLFCLRTSSFSTLFSFLSELFFPLSAS